MELFQTNEHYIILDGDYSLWCSRIDGTLEPKTGLDLCSAWNPVCIGLVYGVIGKIKLHPDADWKLLLIRQQTCIGKVAGEHEVFNINKTAVLTLSQTEPSDMDLDLCKKHHFGMKKVERITPMAERLGKPGLQKTWNTLKTAAAETVKTRKQKDTKDREKFERRIMEELMKMYNESDSFYYSQTFDLTNTIHRQNSKFYDKCRPIGQLADERFFWNRHMLKELIDLEDELAGHWIQPIIQGCIDIEKCELLFNSGSDVSPVIPKPHIIKDPIFYNLILIARRSRHRAGTRSKKRGLDENGHCANYVETEQIIEFGPHCTSFVQVRGSIPVFWSQTGVKYRPPPKLDKGEQETHEAFSKHINEQLELYKSVSVVTLAELGGKEKAIGDAFLNHVILYNSADMTYITFDFHEYCRGMKFENVSILTEGIKDIIKYMRYCWVDRKGMICEQRGVFRVNCVDCLDRTNVVQTAIARIVLETQCRKLGLLAPDENLPENCRKLYQRVWANSGDAISRQYAGTAALKGDFTRTGERKISGMMKDGVNSANRYYLRFKDTYRQAAIDITHGQPVSEDILSDKLRMPEDDFREVMEKEENLKTLIEDSKKMLIVEPEQCMSGWSLVNGDPACSDPDRQEMDMILLLSQRSVYVCWYDEDEEQVTQYQRIYLEDIEKIEIGAEASLFKSKSVCMRLYYRHMSGEGFFHTFRAPSTRMFNNIVITVKTQEEARESLNAIYQTFAAAQKIMSLDLPIVERSKLEKKRTLSHPDVCDIHTQLQQKSLTTIKLPRDISSSDMSSPGSSRRHSPAVRRKEQSENTSKSQGASNNSNSKTTAALASTRNFLSQLPKFGKNKNGNASFELSVPKISIQPMNFVNKIKAGNAGKIFSKGTSLFQMASKDRPDGRERSVEGPSTAAPVMIKRERKRTLSRDDSSLDEANDITETDLNQEVLLDSCGILAANTKRIFESPQFSLEEEESEEEGSEEEEGDAVLVRGGESIVDTTSGTLPSKISALSEIETTLPIVNNPTSLNEKAQSNLDICLTDHSGPHIQQDPTAAAINSPTPTDLDIAGTQTNPVSSEPTLATTSSGQSDGGAETEPTSSFRCFRGVEHGCHECKGTRNPADPMRKQKSEETLHPANEKRTVVENSEADQILEKYAISSSQKVMHHPHMRISLSDSALASSGGPFITVEDEAERTALDLDFQGNDKLLQKLPNILQSSAMPRKSQRIYESLKEQIQNKLGDKECQSRIIFI